MNNFPKLWEQYPEVWKTKGAFFSWLRGQLRRAIWEKFPPKIMFKKKACTKPPKGYTGRAKSGTECALTGEWTGKSKLEVDHIKGHASLRDWDDLVPFILHLLCDESNMQLVSKEAHKIKSYAERKGISFEEAALEKEVIQKTKQPISKQKKELSQHGYRQEEISNNDGRRRCYRSLLSKRKS